jgi:hypothetical protein
MLTLLALSTDGGWPILYDVLDPTGGMNQLLLLFFTAFTQIAVLNIILGIFVEEAMKSMTVSKEEMAMDHIDEEVEIESNILSLCKKADPEGTGWMTKKGWKKAVQAGGMDAYLDLIGLRTHNIMDYFDALARLHSEEKVDIQAFVRGCMHMKGSAAGFDMQLVLHDVKAILKIVQQDRRDIKTLLAETNKIEDNLGV